jgi:hypothetical protein
LKNYIGGGLMFVEENGMVLARRGICLLKVAPGQRARVCLQSEHVEIVQTHWFGRQMLCPGWDCPACGTYATRVAVFQIGVVWQGPEWRPVLVELTAGEWARTRMLAQMEGLELGLGVVCELSRGGPRSAVRCVPIERTGEISVVLQTAERLTDALALLFKLPARGDGEGSKAWCERIRPAVATQLAAAIRSCG